MAILDRKPRLMSRKVLLGSTLGGALFFMIVGVIFWGGFNTAMEATNTLDFCISCHEMEENVYQEYKKTIHFSNRSGVRATCSDCHVPDPWVHKIVRKVQASNELLHKAMGTIDTPEKFDKHRLEMAKRVWKAMKTTDSRECRNCHDFGSMDPEKQKGRARKQHINAMNAGNTCIDCHKGIAHNKVHDQLSDEELEEIEKPTPANKRPIPDQWLTSINNSKKKSSKKATATEQQASVAIKPKTTKPATTPTGGSGVNWDSIEPAEITLFYPGQASLEWVLQGTDHGGARPLKAGDPCTECHEEEEADIGELIVTGEKLEPNPIPGKRGSIVVNIQSTHDNDYLYMRFQWPDTEHAPTPFANDGKMDPDNQIKLAVMLTTDDEKVEFADRAGCWQSCHHDTRTMPHAPDAGALASTPLAQTLNLGDGVTKYLKESRTGLEIRGKGGMPRGGWDKLKGDAEIQAALKDGQFMDLLRYKSGTGESEDGYILSERIMNGGQGVSFTGALVDGIWTVEMKRKLASDQPGDISLSVGNQYNIGFAIHDDYSNARYHHVSFGFKLGFDDEETDINAVAQ